MGNYEIDVVTISEGALVTLSKGDIIIGMKSDGTEFYILRADRTSARG